MITLGQPHTVTSLPAVSIFNSGIIPYGAFFQYTFDTDQAGEFTYHCEIHPWRTGKVSVDSPQLNKEIILSQIWERDLFLV